MEKHVESLLRKTGATSRTMLVAITGPWPQAPHAPQAPPEPEPRYVAAGYVVSPMPPAAPPARYR